MTMSSWNNSSSSVDPAPIKRRLSARQSRSPEKKARTNSAGSSSRPASGSKEVEVDSTGSNPDDRSGPNNVTGSGVVKTELRVENGKRVGHASLTPSGDQPFRTPHSRGSGEYERSPISIKPSPTSVRIASPSPSAEGSRSGDEDQDDLDEEDEDEDERGYDNQSATRHHSSGLNDRNRSTHPSHSAAGPQSTFNNPQSSMAPTWATSGSDRDQHTLSPSSSSRSSGLIQIPAQLSTSAPSRLPSPPNYSTSPNQTTSTPNPPLKTQAAFVGKLYAMLEDEEIAKSGLIRWSADGTIFTCPNPTEFSKIVLPRYFKHNNWQSFVRQLNMYSFNKVNDLFATTTDPQAWEFRHPLFRRGEPQSLSQIKRKSARPAASDHGHGPSSPPDEANEKVAGWMKADRGYRMHSPPREASNRVYGYNMQTGETILPRAASQQGIRPISRGNPWDRERDREREREHDQGRSMHRSVGRPGESRYHPETSRPSISNHRYGSYTESITHGPNGGSISVDVLTNQVATLEDRVTRLTSVLNDERVENVRSHLETTAYMLQMLGWVGGQDVPNPQELRAMHDTLNRQGLDLRQRYETLLASDALATLATLGSASREERSGRPRDQAHVPAPNYTRSNTLPDPRTRDRDRELARDHEREREREREMAPNSSGRPTSRPSPLASIFSVKPLGDQSSPTMNHNHNLSSSHSSNAIGSGTRPSSSAYNNHNDHLSTSLPPSNPSSYSSSPLNYMSSAASSAPTSRGSLPVPMPMAQKRDEMSTATHANANANKGDHRDSGSRVVSLREKELERERDRDKQREKEREALRDRRADGDLNMGSGGEEGRAGPSGLRNLLN